MNHGIALLILSLAAMPSMLLYKRRGGLKILNKLVHLQGWFGLMVCFYGIFSLVNYGFLKSQPEMPSLLFQIVVNLFQILLGYLLGYCLILRYVYASNSQTRQRGDQLLLSLAPVLGKTAIGAFIVAVGYLLWAHHIGI